jgi:hypothetical protein
MLLGLDRSCRNGYGIARTRTLRAQISVRVRNSSSPLVENLESDIEGDDKAIAKLLARPDANVCLRDVYQGREWACSTREDAVRGRMKFEVFVRPLGGVMCCSHAWVHAVNPTTQ